MSHAVENMMYLGATPWHGLGTKLDAPPTSAEAIEAAGLNWDVELQSLKSDEGIKSDNRLVVRSTDRKALCTVGPNWTPVQNSKAFDWFDHFIRNGTAQYECAGSLFGGRRVWILAKILKSSIKSGDTDLGFDFNSEDTNKHYVLLSNDHGLRSLICGLTRTRVVCANTEAVALKADAANMIKTPHTRYVNDRLDSYQAAIDEALVQSALSVKQIKKMQGITVRKRSQVSTYLAAVFGSAEVKAQEKAAKKNRLSPLHESIEQLQVNGRGTKLPGVQGTGRGLYHAISEYLTHVQGRTKDQRKAAELRADRNFNGEGARLLSRAMSDDLIKLLQERSAEQVIQVGASAALN